VAARAAQPGHAPPQARLLFRKTAAVTSIPFRVDTATPVEA